MTFISTRDNMSKIFSTEQSSCSCAHLRASFSHCHRFSDQFCSSRASVWQVTGFLGYLEANEDVIEVHSRCPTRHHLSCAPNRPGTIPYTQKMAQIIPLESLRYL